MKLPEINLASAKARSPVVVCERSTVTRMVPVQILRSSLQLLGPSIGLLGNADIYKISKLCAGALCLYVYILS